MSPDSWFSGLGIRGNYIAREALNVTYHARAQDAMCGDYKINNGFT